MSSNQTPAIGLPLDQLDTASDVSEAVASEEAPVEGEKKKRPSRKKKKKTTLIIPFGAHPLHHAPPCTNLSSLVASPVASSIRFCPPFSPFSPVRFPPSPKPSAIWNA